MAAASHAASPEAGFVGPMQVSNNQLRPRTAVSTAFFLLGLGSGIWAVHIPLVQARLEIAPSTLGFALFAMAIGAVLAMPLTGWTIGRLGSRRPTAFLTIAFTVITPLPAMAGSVSSLFAAAWLFGLAMGGLDVAMNVQAAEIEAARRRPTMSSFHGFFSVGGLAGALVGAALIAAGWGNGEGAAALAAILLGPAILSACNLFPGAPAEASGSPRFSLPDRAVLAFCILAFLCFAVEGAVTDWSALYLTSVKGAAPAAAAGGFALFSLAMAACRLTGDTLVARLGGRTVLIGGGFLIAAGLGIALASPWPLVGALGFGILGVGAANIVPVLFSRAARTPGVEPSTGVAAVATLGYSGFLATPPVLGLVADAHGLSVALGLVLLMGLAIACLGLFQRN
jgi:fucose permease